MLQRLAIAFLLMVPLLYGAPCLWSLWSNWDPYGKTDQMPVAVVNQDVPVAVSGTTVNAGRLFTRALRADPIFDWHFTDAADGDAGLHTGRYQILIRVPKTFSADLASGSTTTPRRATLGLNVDDGNGCLIEIIAKTAKVETTQKVDQAATTAYFESVYGQLADGAQQVANGAAQLHTGLTTAASGAHQLDSGAHQLVSGADRLHTGADRLAHGLITAVNRLPDLSDGQRKARQWRDGCR